MAMKKVKLVSKSGNNKKKPEADPERPLTHREKQILGIRENLSRQKEAILSEAEVAMTALPEQTVFPDLGDQASAEMDRNFMLRLRGREQRLLKKIEEAIERIDTGVFGICDVCGEAIDIKRLTARPVTTMCITCKTEQEEEEKLQGH
jgi:DnaK suppressor protein